MDQDQFNQMRRPRPVKFKLKSLFFLIFLMPLFLVFASGYYTTQKSRDFIAKLQKDGIKVTGKVENVGLQRLGKRNVMMVTYSYEYLNLKYSGRAVEYGRHISGQPLTVHISNEDPSTSRPDFTIEESRRPNNYQYLPFLFPMFVMLVTTLILGFSVKSMQKTLQYGQMDQAKILAIYRGKSAGAKVEYTVRGIKYERRINFQPKGENIGDMVSIVYLPENPKKVVRYPNLIFEVLGPHSFSDRV